MRSPRGRNRTPDPTEMAQASGQDRVEQDGGVAILPGAGAVPPPCQCARHGASLPVLPWRTGSTARPSSCRDFPTARPENHRWRASGCLSRVQGCLHL